MTLGRPASRSRTGGWWSSTRYWRLVNLIVCVFRQCRALRDSSSPVALLPLRCLCGAPVLCPSLPVLLRPAADV